MDSADKLMEIINGLDCPKYKNEKQAYKLMAEVLDIHLEFVSLKRGVLPRELKRRIRKAFKHLPYDVYEQVGLHKGLKSRHIKLICTA